MFERFTDRARRVVVLAQEQARLLNHDFIGTEHILLGLVDEGEGVAAQALEGLGIRLEAVRTQVEETVGRGESTPSGHIAFTPRSKKVLELSLREALQLAHNYIGTEHLLLGLIREQDGVAATVLVEMGADLSTVRQRVLQILAGRGAVVEEALPIEPGRSAATVERRLRLARAAAGRRTEPSSRHGDVPRSSLDGLVLRRFTVPACRVLLLAESEALRLGSVTVEPRHLLLGLLAEGEGDAARALGAVGIDLDRVRSTTERLTGRTPLAGPVQATYGDTVLDALERALGEALAAGREAIDTGDLLLGLVRQAELDRGGMRTAFAVEGTTPEAVRRALDGPDAPGGTAPDEGDGS